MGNASSTEQPGNGGHHGGANGGLNPLARPRSHAGASSQKNPHNPLTQTSSSHGRSSPSWVRHGSLRRGSSQAPSTSSSQHLKNTFFRDTSTPTTANAELSGRSGDRRRSRSGSMSLSLKNRTEAASPVINKGKLPEDDPTTPTAREPRERSATMGSTSLDSQYVSGSSRKADSSQSPERNRVTSSSGTTSLGGSIFRRGSRFGSARQKSIDLQDVQDAQKSGSGPSTPHGAQQTSSPTPPWQASLTAQSIISPYPSPSIATDSRHASGTNTYLNADHSKASSPQTVPPSATQSSNRPFGRGVAAIFGNPGHSLGSTAAASLSTTADGSFSSPTGRTSIENDREEGPGASSSGGPSSPREHGSNGGQGKGSGFGRRSQSGNTGASGPIDALGRQVASVFPSYLKIPTLIPSKQEQPMQPSLSVPASPTGSGPESGNLTPGSSGWSGVAATAAKTTSAVLTPEEVVIAPGGASRVSSPISEELPEATSVSGEQANRQAEEDRAAISETNSTQSAEGNSAGDNRSSEGDDTRKSVDTVSGRNQTSLSRTPTPTQKSHHATKALTPARGAEASPSPKAQWRGSPGASETSSDQWRRLHVATGVASGTSTPVMPIPPGLTSAPPSAMSPAVSSGYTTPARQGSDHDLGAKTPSASKGEQVGHAKEEEPKTPTDLPPSSSGPAVTTPKPRHPHHLTPYYYRNAKGPISLMPIVITWRGGGKEVFVTGTFANEWRSKILLKRTQTSSSGGASSAGGRRGHQAKEEHTVVLHLPPGTHRMKFIVDDKWRVSRELPTASDGDGNLVNYLEIPNVGPAHPGPLSAPGEDLIDGNERKRERDVERIKEAEKAARQRSRSRDSSKAEKADTATATPKLGTSAAEVGAPEPASQDQEMGDATISSEASEGVVKSEENASTIEAARRKAVLDLRDEARRAELIKNGQLEEVFGIDEALRAAENWVQEVPESVVKAHYAEEQWHDEIERLENSGHHLHQEQQQPPYAPPPALPRQLEKVILNSSPANPALAPPGGTVDDNSILPAPNHVVLNHLTASAIKGGVLAVGTTTRYKRKYVTTVLYRPV
ncbi:unnamed protein product [Sympodiomycopsis kandeliae]